MRVKALLTWTLDDCSQGSGAAWCRVPLAHRHSLSPQTCSGLQAATWDQPAAHTLGGATWLWAMPEIGLSVNSCCAAVCFPPLKGCLGCSCTPLLQAPAILPHWAPCAGAAVQPSLPSPSTRCAAAHDGRSCALQPTQAMMDAMSDSGIMLVQSQAALAAVIYRYSHVMTLKSNQALNKCLHVPCIKLCTRL